MSLYYCLVFQSYSASPSVTPDDDVFQHLSLTYSKNHHRMNQGLSCKTGSPSFTKGITNGAAWYPLTGATVTYLIVESLNGDAELYSNVRTMQFQGECKTSITFGTVAWK